MNEFPLTPFLALLEASDIRATLDDYDRILRALQARGPWTIAGLRGVLLAVLVQHPGQEKTFLRHFDDFFSPTIQFQVLTAEQLNLIWQELRALANADEVESSRVPPPPPVIASGTPGRSEKRKNDFLLRWLKNKSEFRYPSLLVLVLLVAGGLVYTYRRPTPALSDQLAVVNAPPPTLTPQNSNTPNAPRTADLVEKPTPIAKPDERQPPWNGWKYWLGICGGLLLLALGYAVFQRRASKRPVNAPQLWDPDAPSYFSLNNIGGKRTPVLDSAILDQLADSLSYFKTCEPGKLLDLRASVEAMVRHSGAPQLVFCNRKQLRTVYILEDVFAESLVWNPISQELADGLRNRGIHVRYGKFEGSPARLRMEDGSVVAIEDLDDKRGDYFLLLFSDSKGLRPRRDAFVLEALVHWPFVAWMELRETRFWDESTAFVAHYGLPIYPASGSGLIQAMQRFLTEQGAEKSPAANSREWRGVPANVGNNLTHVESLLGDALPWAQACAMIQPITLGLADAVRCNFQPLLPAERIERLFYLPGTIFSISGLRFSLPVLAILRAGFTHRWSQQMQEEILTFLLERIRETEPKPNDSIAHLCWQYLMARVYLELQPDAALEQISKLERTPLKNTIRFELKNIVLPSEPLSDLGSAHITRMPLRCKPTKREAMEYLAGLTPNVLVDDYFPKSKLRELVTPSWREPAAYSWGALRALVHPALWLLAAFALFSLLVTPWGAFFIVCALLFVVLIFHWIERLNNWIERRKQIEGAQVHPAVFGDASWSFIERDLRSRIELGLVALFVAVLVVIGISISNEPETKPPPSTASTVPAPPANMVYVPGGTFLMGSDSGDQYNRPAHFVVVQPFYIDSNEVTCGEYETFVKATGHQRPPNWLNATCPSGSARNPVTRVDWYDATAYAEWQNKRLPTEEEWEFAARGTDGRQYPWGEEWGPNRANAGDSSAGHVVNVGSYPDGRSPLGLMDTIGNVWEWTASELRAYPGGQLPPHSPGEYKVIRGGSWKEDKNQATVTYRGYLLAKGGQDYTSTGFRCVADGDKSLIRK